MIFDALMRKIGKKIEVLRFYNGHINSGQNNWFMILRDTMSKA